MKRFRLLGPAVLAAAASLATLPAPAQARGPAGEGPLLQNLPAVTEAPANGFPLVPPPPDRGAADGCGAGEACCVRSGNWVAGFEAVFLAPHARGPAARYQIERLVDPRDYSSAAAEVDGLYVTPRLWLGYQGECWGVVGRYWRLRESEAEFQPFSLVSDGLLAQQALKAETLDLELTRSFCIGRTDLQASFGARYAELGQTAYLSASDLTLSDLFSGEAYARQSFSGAGITGALTGTRPIGSGAFHLFYTFRGSVLWDADALSLAETQALYGGGAGTALSLDGALASGSSRLFIGEVQFGGQWNFALACLPAHAFLRAAVEYQHWETDGPGDVSVLSFAGSDTGLGTARAASGDARVDMVGFNLGAGFTW